MDDSSVTKRPKNPPGLLTKQPRTHPRTPTAANTGATTASGSGSKLSPAVVPFAPGGSPTATSAPAQAYASISSRSHLPMASPPTRPRALEKNSNHTRSSSSKTSAEISPRTSIDTDGSGSQLQAGVLAGPFALGNNYGVSISNGSSERTSGAARATANRLETSTLVLSALRDVDGYTSKGKGKGKETSVPAADAARYALGVLEIIREIAGDHVDENLVLLALDSCGLVYIAINSCMEEMERTGTISSRTKVDLIGLTSNLNAIQTFVHKHVTRGFAKRLLKHGDDNQMILVHRQKLKYWMTRFLGNDSVDEAMSIHDVLDRLVQQQSARVSTKHKQGRSSVEVPITPALPIEIDKTQKPISIPDTDAKPRIRRTRTVTKPLPVPEVKLSPSEAVATPVQPENIHHPATDNRDTTKQSTQKPAIRALPKSPAQNLLTHSRTSSRDEGHLELDEVELRRKARLEKEKAQRMAERARWLKSEEEFNRLPFSDEVVFTTSSSLRQQPEIPTSFPRNELKGRSKQEVGSEHKQTASGRELAPEGGKTAKILADKLDVEDRRARLLNPERRSVESVGRDVFVMQSSSKR